MSIATILFEASFSCGGGLSLFTGGGAGVVLGVSTERASRLSSNCWSVSFVVSSAKTDIEENRTKNKTAKLRDSLFIN